MTDAHGKILGGALFASAAVARPRQSFPGDRDGVVGSVRPGARHEEWIT